MIAAILLYITKNRMFKLIIISIGIFAYSMELSAQKVTNVQAAVKDDIIIVTYDLLSDSKEDFTVNLHSSKDDFKDPLILVTGDVGQNVQAGKGKRIEWLAKSELGDFSGSLIFEIRAIIPQVAYESLKLKDLNVNSIKPGETLPIEWSGGKENEDIEILLFKNGNQIKKIAQVKNNGSYIWNIPEKEKGSKYRIQLSADSGIVGSSEFKIRPAFPLFLIIGSAVVVGGTVTAIILLNGDEAPGGQTNSLPEPPDPN
jgi:hypothetical protein